MVKTHVAKILHQSSVKNSKLYFFIFEKKNSKFRNNLIIEKTFLYSKIIELFLYFPIFFKLKNASAILETLAGC